MARNQLLKGGDVLEWTHHTWNASGNHTKCIYRLGTVNSNTVNSKFHLIRNYCEIFFYHHFPNISCLKYTVNSNFHLIQSKNLLTNDFELKVPDLYLLLETQLSNSGTL